MKINKVDVALLPSCCPSCGGDLRVTRVSCTRCDTVIEGAFALPSLLQLSAEDLDFITMFVRLSGSLKQMAKHYDRSYPTIRNRLNEIIERLPKDEPQDSTARRRKILEQIEAGQLEVSDAIKLLKEILS